MIGSTCPACGVPRPSGARFCAHCGAAFDPAVRGARLPSASRASVLAGLGVAATLVGSIAGVGVVLGRPDPTAPPAVAGPSAASVASPGVAPTAAPTFAPAGPMANPTLAGRRTARIGERIEITGLTGERLGWVRVTEAVRYTTLRGLDAPSRFMWVGARVEYTADAPLGYAELDWMAQDAGGTRYEPSAFSREPALALGTLDPGGSASGWIAFEVPQSVEHLWATFVNLDGGIVFGVLLF